MYIQSLLHKIVVQLACKYPLPVDLTELYVLTVVLGDFITRFPTL